MKKLFFTIGLCIFLFSLTASLYSQTKIPEKYRSISGRAYQARQNWEIFDSKLPSEDWYELLNPLSSDYLVPGNILQSELIVRHEIDFTSAGFTGMGVPQDGKSGSMTIEDGGIFSFTRSVIMDDFDFVIDVKEGGVLNFKNSATFRLGKTTINNVGALNFDENIEVLPIGSITSALEINGDLILNSNTNILVDGGCALIINGNLEQTNGTLNIMVINGGTLFISGDLLNNSPAFPFNISVIGAESKFIIGGSLNNASQRLVANVISGGDFNIENSFTNETLENLNFNLDAGDFKVGSSQTDDDFYTNKSRFHNITAINSSAFDIWGNLNNDIIESLNIDLSQSTFNIHGDLHNIKSRYLNIAPVQNSELHIDGNLISTAIEHLKMDVDASDVYLGIQEPEKSAGNLDNTARFLYLYLKNGSNMLMNGHLESVLSENNDIEISNESTLEIGEGFTGTGRFLFLEVLTNSSLSLGGVLQSDVIEVNNINANGAEYFGLLGGILATSRSFVMLVDNGTTAEFKGNFKNESVTTNVDFKNSFITTGSFEFDDPGEMAINNSRFRVKGSFTLGPDPSETSAPLSSGLLAFGRDYRLTTINSWMRVDGNLDLNDNAYVGIGTDKFEKPDSLVVIGNVNLGDGSELIVNARLAVIGNVNASWDYTSEDPALHDFNTDIRQNKLPDPPELVRIQGSGCEFWFGPDGTCVEGVPLPVELVYFNATYIAGEVQLNWRTLTEVNNDFFTIERSSDGKNFEAIGRVAGSGNSDVLINYQFTDPLPLFGVSYYRLKQTDFDGTTEIFRMVAVNNELSGEGLTLYPNPSVDGTVTIRANGLQDYENVTISVSDLNGRIVRSYETDADGQGMVYQELDLNGNARQGIYIVSLRQGSIQQNNHLVIR